MVEGCPEEFSWALRDGVECRRPGEGCRPPGLVVGGLMEGGCPGYLGSYGGRDKNKRARDG